MLYCTVLYCAVLYCTVLYCTVLYLSAVLQGEAGEAVVLVDPDHAVAQPAHAQHPAPSRVDALATRPPHAHCQALQIFSN